jgi:uncharacterized protein YbdZ (MbtH family)
MSEEYPDWQDGRLKVVCNGEHVCSIWPAERKNAMGWEDVGFSGTREECLDYVKAHCDSYCRLLKASESSSAQEHESPVNEGPQVCADASTS